MPYTELHFWSVIRPFLGLFNSMSRHITNGYLLFHPALRVLRVNSEGLLVLDSASFTRKATQDVWASLFFGIMFDDAPHPNQYS